ncbi:MAG: NAD(P) transhydrogenase subunit alpha [Planctomycetota bacterium]|nr:NAD(P) transhydrogenase subunit alpha [Planctomycetota bacterium]
MQIAVPKETDPVETRVAMTPDVATKLVKAGLELRCESGLGAAIGFPDEAYVEAGAEIIDDRDELLGNADLVLRVRAPEPDAIGPIKEGALHVSYLDVFNRRDVVEAMAAAKLTCGSMEMIPRSTRAQKMDALSSQHSLAGYYMVLLAAERLGKALPMMMTPAGTIQPARVFVIGAGVAGLQAIATAKRLGARVEAFDTRPDTAEQVRSLGAKFVEVDLGETGQTDQGYAKELTDEQKAKQREGMAAACAIADIVITTAQLFGRPAPVVVHQEMLAAMKPGSVVIDYAVESGGNVAGSKPGEEVTIDGVRVIGLRNYPGQVAKDAARMYAANLGNFVLEFWDAEAKELKLSEGDEIVDGLIITRAGEIVHPTVRKHYELPELPQHGGES